MNKKYIAVLALLVLTLASCTSKEEAAITSIVDTDTEVGVQSDLVANNDIDLVEEVEEIEEDTTLSNNEVETPQEETAEAPILAVASKGEYKDFDGTVPGNSVLFFHATWCPSCAAADSGFSSESELAIDADIIKVDYDDNADLKSKYGVTAQHTFVLVDEEGNLVKKMLGATKSSELLSLFN